MAHITVDERFWSKVAVTGDCWLWMAFRNASGYGRFWLGGPTRQAVLAHRFAYELLVGPIPDGLDLDHLCRNRACVNPDHLEPVTRRENTLRGLCGDPATHHNALKTHCPEGHNLDAENVRLNAAGSRECRSCRRDDSRRYRARKKAARAVALPDQER